MEGSGCLLNKVMIIFCTKNRIAITNGKKEEEKIHSCSTESTNCLDIDFESRQVRVWVFRWTEDL